MVVYLAPRKVAKTDWKKVLRRAAMTDVHLVGWTVHWRELPMAVHWAVNWEL